MADTQGLRIASLCSGIAGLDLGLHQAIPGSRTVVFCERDAFASAVLLEGMAQKALADAPVWCGDIGGFDGSRWRGRVDLLCAGYP